MPKAKLLLVDDEPDLVDMMRVRLETNGYEVTTAYDGEEGLRKAQDEKPDLILLDILMPKLNGIEVCSRLRQNPNTCNIPIIAITAAGENDIRRKCLGAGANCCILKPYEPQDLLAKIKSLLKE